jgi:hypothetical protein
MIILAIITIVILVAWLDRIVRAQEVAALTLIRLYAALMNRNQQVSILSKLKLS